MAPPLCPLTWLRSRRLEPDLIPPFDITSYHFNDAALICHFDLTCSQNIPWWLWTPLTQMLSVLVSALWQQILPRSCMMANLPMLTVGGVSGTTFMVGWPSTLFSQLTRPCPDCPSILPPLSWYYPCPLWVESLPKDHWGCHTEYWSDAIYAGVPRTWLVHQGFSNYIRLHYLYRCYNDEDHPPSRFNPMSLQVIQRIFNISTSQQSAVNSCITDMTFLDYFSLICPGEYITSTK